jgi:hypothetical protein
MLQPDEHKIDESLQEPATILERFTYRHVSTA